jgi:hypothetical protein
MKQTSEAAFETAIEAVLLDQGYSRVDGKGFDRERAIFPDEALAFIQATQAKVWGKAGGPARWADRRAGAGGPMQVAGYPRHPGHPAPRV